MNFYEYIKMTINHIKKSRTRAMLTILGITIGISSMVTVISVGDGGEDKIKNELEKFGINRGWIITNEVIYDSVKLKASDKQLIMESIEGIKNISESKYEQGTIEYNGKKEYSEIVGTSNEQFDIEKSVMVQGRALSCADIEYHRKVIVLNEDIAQALFGDKECLGEKVEVFGSRYIVVGVEKAEQGMYSSIFSEKCYIPNTTLNAVFGYDSIDELTLTTLSSERLSPVLSSSVELLNKKYGEDSFKYINLQTQLENAQNIIDIFKTVVSAIAAISLLVGGVGIMNIMLVTVNERTKEIGIRKALGAKDHQILNQFLCESIMYSLIGAIIGLLISKINILFAERILNISIEISYQSVVFSVIFAVTIGLVFGIIPANKAAKLNPVDALRQD